MTLPLDLSFLEQIESDIDVDFQGRAKATIRATANLAGVNDKSLRAAFESAELEPSKLAQKIMQQGFEGAELTTWAEAGIPDIAIAAILEYYAFDAGRYCKEQARQIYKAFATVGIRVWMQQVKGWQQEVTPPALLPTPVTLQTETLLPTPQEISDLLDIALSKTDLHPNLIAGAKLNAIAKIHPSYQLIAEQIKPLLSTPVESELLSPTQLASLLQEKTEQIWSNRKVNKALSTLGLQIKNPSGDNPPYLPTEKGKQYGQLVLDIAKGRDKTVQSLRWHKEVMEVLEDY